MLTCGLNYSNDSDMQLSTQGNWHTVHTNVKNSFPHPPWDMLHAKV